MMQRFTRLLPVVALLAPVAPTPDRPPPRLVSIVVTTQDALVLAREAAATVPIPFAIEVKRIQLFPPQARIQVTVAGTCDITIDGTPVLSGGVVSVAAPKEYRDGWSCAAVPALKLEGWDLGGRLRQATCDPALKGPRLPNQPCLPSGAVQIISIQVLADGMHVVARVTSPY